LEKAEMLQEPSLLFRVRRPDWEPTLMNYLWLFAVAGGAALLGMALAFGMIKQDGRRSLFAIAGAFIVAIGALGLGVYVAKAPAAPVRASDREQSQQRLPAAATTEKDLPGN
jgi:hypothetical protein